MIFSCDVQVYDPTALLKQIRKALDRAAQVTVGLFEARHGDRVRRGLLENT